MGYEHYWVRKELVRLPIIGGSFVGLVVAFVEIVDEFSKYVVDKDKS
jgi:hypothetical protein